MRRITLGVLTALMMLALSLASIPAASAGGTELDGYCGESGDFCTSVVEKDDGAIVFQIRAFANYFGRAQACVTKDTRVCRGRSPHRDHGLFEWTIRWQANFPDEGPGRYAVRWLYQGDRRIGPALHFERG